MSNPLGPLHIRLRDLVTRTEHNHCMPEEIHLGVANLAELQEELGFKPTFLYGCRVVPRPDKEYLVLIACRP